MQITLKDLISKAGGTVQVASACGVTPGAVSHWIKAGSLPLTEVQGKTNHAIKIIRLTGDGADEWEVRLLGRR